MFLCKCLFCQKLKEKTPISSKEFWDVITARMLDYGRPINAKYAEAFTVERTIGVNNVFDLI